MTKCDRDDRDDRDDGDERTTRQIRTRFPNAVRYLVYLSACPLVRLSACPVSSVPLLSLKRQKRQKRLKGSRYQRRCPSHPFGPYRPYVYRGAEATNFGMVKKKNPRRSCSTRVFSTQSRGRTGTGVNLLVFETSASTDSAIWASVFD